MAKVSVYFIPREWNFWEKIRKSGLVEAVVTLFQVVCLGWEPILGSDFLFLPADRDVKLSAHRVQPCLKFRS